MAAAEAAGGERGTFDNTVGFQGFGGIGGAAGLKTAIRAQPWRYAKLIGANKGEAEER